MAGYTPADEAIVKKAVDGAKGLISKHAILASCLSGTNVSKPFKDMLAGVPECTPGRDDALSVIDALTALYSAAPVATPVAAAAVAPVATPVATPAVAAAAAVAPAETPVLAPVPVPVYGAAVNVAPVAAPAAPVAVPAAPVAAPAAPVIYDGALFDSLCDASANLGMIVEQLKMIVDELPTDRLSEVHRNRIFANTKSIEDKLQELIDTFNEASVPADAK